MVHTENLLSSTLLCLCLLLMFYNLYIMCSLARERASSRKSNACQLCKPHLIHLSFWFFLITCNLITPWSLIMLFQYHVLLLREILLVIQYCTVISVFLLCMVSYIVIQLYLTSSFDATFPSISIVYNWCFLLVSVAVCRETT